MTPAELSAAYLSILTGIVERRGAADTVTVQESHAALERPKNRAHGDWASNAAMQLAKRLGTNPRELATEIAGELTELDGVASVDVAGPGFINITLEAAAAGEVARTVVEQGTAYGHGDLYDGVRIDLEFVSANPTGPIHMGGVRWAAVGDSLARVFQAQGALVTREYYFNDHGSQIDRFARSLVASALGEPTPEDGYGGAYIGEIAARVIATYDGDVADLPRDEAQELFRREGVEFMFADIKHSLHEFGVDFDVYFHENELHESKAVERAIERLRENGHMYEAEGAQWLRTTDFGDDRDRVVIKSDGEPAYIAGDLAYYLDKRERGFERNLIMLGADHHGYVGRMMAMCAAFGDEPGKNLEILIGQMVNLLKDGEPMRMSKRNGTIVTMEDLVDAVGVDAGRYSLVRFASDTAIDIDLDLLVKRTNDNPVFTVQYAHARTQSVARNAAAAGVDRSVFDASLLTHETESALLGALAEYPRVLRQAAELREPHRIARFIEQLAGLYHRWYDSCRVTPLGDEPVTDLHRTRLWVNDATGQVVRNGLGLLGVSAPDRM
ncbi:arginine--tRNA ligase [Curtobacterium aetherium]|uniref:arginine--tRNA ligase n=1 Tax=Curtobacterium aetherium TaxID=2841594 RepID=UPI003B51A4A0